MTCRPGMTSELGSIRILSHLSQCQNTTRAQATRSKSAKSKAKKPRAPQQSRPDQKSKSQMETRSKARKALLKSATPAKEATKKATCSTPAGSRLACLVACHLLALLLQS